MVWILGRTVCGDNENTPADGYLITRTIQYQMKMYTLEQYENGTTDVPLTGEVEEEYADIVPLNYVIYNLTAEEFFDRANALMLTNPPAEADATVLAAMAAVGVGPGLDFDPSVLGGEAAVRLYMAGSVRILYPTVWELLLITIKKMASGAATVIRSATTVLLMRSVV